MKSCHLCIFYLIWTMLTVIIVCSLGELSVPSNKLLHSFHEDKNQSNMHPNNRKLLVHDSCTNRDISISQSKDTTSGIPQYIVQIVNTGVFGCSPSDIHLHCGWFASARIVNPKTFKRLSYDDCLVNGGKPLKTSQIIRFTYSNSFMYPIAFKSAKFLLSLKLHESAGRKRIREIVTPKHKIQIPMKKKFTSDDAAF